MGILAVGRERRWLMMRPVGWNEGPPEAKSAAARPYPPLLAARQTARSGDKRSGEPGSGGPAGIETAVDECGQLIHRIAANADRCRAAGTASRGSVGRGFRWRSRRAHRAALGLGAWGMPAGVLLGLQDRGLFEGRGAPARSGRY